MCWHLPLAGLRLRMLGLQRCLALLERSPVPLAQALPAGLDAAAYAQRCAALLAIAARRGWYPATCLPLSLALHALLRRGGLRSRLRVGVMPGSAPLHAHAWVELQGQALGDAGHLGFSAFPEVSAP